MPAPLIVMPVSFSLILDELDVGRHLMPAYRRKTSTYKQTKSQAPRNDNRDIILAPTMSSHFPSATYTWTHAHPAVFFH